VKGQAPAVMLTELAHPVLIRRPHASLPSSILEPLWVQVTALLPTRQVYHRWAATARVSPTGASSTSSSKS
jgi:hypothetical protein